MILLVKARFSSNSFRSSISRIMKAQENAIAAPANVMRMRLNNYHCK